MAAAQRSGGSVEFKTLSSNLITDTGSATLTAWKLEALPALDALLSRQIGPVAKVLLKKVLAKADHIDELCDLLLQHIPSDLGRMQFQKAVHELKNKLTARGIDIGSSSSSSSSSLHNPNSMRSVIAKSASGATLTHSPFIDEAFAEAATRQLMVVIGPIARVVAKRAMHQCESKTEFLRLLAEHIATLPERNRFLINTGSI